MLARGRAAFYSPPMFRRFIRRSPGGRLLALVACLLLLGLQQESLRHGVKHIGEQVAAHERALAVPTVACDECALLAGASAAAIGSSLAIGIAAVHPTAHGAADATVAVAAPRHYAARAPPLCS
jgi:hypothetical protein